MGIGGAGRNSKASSSGGSSQPPQTWASIAGGGASIGQASVPKPAASGVPAGQTMAKPAIHQYLKHSSPVMRYVIARFQSSEKQKSDIQTLVRSASNNLSLRPNERPQSVAEIVNGVNALRAALKVGKQRSITGMTREIYENAICQLEKIGTVEAQKRAVELLKLAMNDEVCSLTVPRYDHIRPTLEVNLHGDQLFPGPEVAGRFFKPKNRDILPPPKEFCQTVVRYYAPYMLFRPVAFITGKGRGSNKNHVLQQLNDKTLYPKTIKAAEDRYNSGAILSEASVSMTFRNKAAVAQKYKNLDTEFPALGIREYLEANPGLGISFDVPSSDTLSLQAPTTPSESTDEWPSL